MTIKMSTAVRNARLNMIELIIGNSAVLKIRTGNPPDHVSDPDSGTVLVTFNLPSDWMTSADNGVKTMNGNWGEPQASAGGIAGHFRIYESDGVTPHLQGTCAKTGQVGDMLLDNTNIALGQKVVPAVFTLRDGNG